MNSICIKYFKQPVPDGLVEAKLTIDPKLAQGTAGCSQQ